MRRQVKTFIASLAILCSAMLYGQQSPNSLSFDGNNDYVSLGDQSVLQQTTSLTVEAWVNFQDWASAGNQTIFSTYNGQGYFLQKQSGNLVASVYRNGALLSTQYNISAFTGWHHVAFAYNGTRIQLFTDGVLRATNNPATAFPITYTTPVTSTIGALSDGSAVIAGNVDEVRVWSTVKTAANLLASMNTELASSASGLLLYYRFNTGIASADNSGQTTLTDLTSNAINGSLNNFALTGSSSNWLDGYPLKPINQANNIYFSNEQPTQLTVNWSRAGIGLGGNKVKVFVIQAATGSAAPVDGTDYAANATFGSGDQIGATGWFCVYDGSGTSATVSGLTEGLQYRFHVIECQSVTGQTIRYSTATGTVNPANNPLFPTTQATEVVISLITSTGFTASWTNGNGAARAVFVCQTTTGSASPINNSTYTANTTFGNGSQIGATGWYCVYNGTGTTVAITGLTAGLTYRVMVCEYNGVAGNEKYLTTTATNNPNNGLPDYTAPTTSTTALTATTIGYNTITTTWTRGNGSNCAVFVRQINTGAPTPVNNTTYTANATFGNGSQIGATGWYCVYNGSGTTVTVTGLTPSLAYRIVVDEYNGTPGLEKYRTAAGTGNAITATTVGLTTWNGAVWSNGVPTAASDAVIAGDFNNTVNITCRALYINPGVTMNILPTYRMTVNNTLTNNGTLILKSTTGTAASGSLITLGSIVNNGTMTADRFISEGTLDASNRVWHFMSSPVASFLAINSFSAEYMHQYLEPTNSWKSIIRTDYVNVGQGYMVKTLLAGGKTITFRGIYNTGNQSVSLTNTGGTATNGYNLVGNPYPSAIDWNAATGWTKTNVSGTIWIWNPSSGVYATWDGAVGTNGGSRYIPAMQGFFIKVLTGSTSGTLAMTNSVRIHNTQAFLKAASSIELLRLKTSGNSFTDELVIYKANRTNDAYKFLTSVSAVPQIYAVNNDKSFSIYKISSDITDTSINIGFKCDSAGVYTISADELSYDLEKYSLTLVDNITHKSIELQQGTVYSFTHSKENNGNRFVLLYTKKAEIPSSIVANNESLSVWSDINKVCLNLPSDEYTKVEVYNILGVKVTSKAFINKGLNTIELNKSGIYFVHLNNKQLKNVYKVYVR
jgi:hypothetical protein